MGIQHIATMDGIAQTQVGTTSIDGFDGRPLHAASLQINLPNGERHTLLMSSVIASSLAASLSTAALDAAMLNEKVKAEEQAPQRCRASHLCDCQELGKRCQVMRDERIEMAIRATCHDLPLVAHAILSELKNITGR